MPYPRSPWRLESHLETIPHLTYRILGGLQYGIHSDMPIRTLSRSAGSTSAWTVPSQPNTPLDGQLFDRELYGGRVSGKRAKPSNPDNFWPRVEAREGWAGLEALVSHRPLCHHSHAKIPSKDAVHLTGSHLPNQVL
jgi:hypothetical protein